MFAERHDDSNSKCGNFLKAFALSSSTYSRSNLERKDILTVVNESNFIVGIS